MLNIMVCCANGAGTSLMMKMTADKVVKALNIKVGKMHHCSLSEGKSAAIIGRVISERPGKVVLRTAMGGGRILQKLAGAQLPRIC